MEAEDEEEQAGTWRRKVVKVKVPVKLMDERSTQRKLVCRRKLRKENRKYVGS